LILYTWYCNVTTSPRVR